MATASCDWQLHLERGPNWLFVSISTRTAGRQAWSTLADGLRSLLEQHFTYRLVLDVAEIGCFTTELIGQLLCLQKWIGDHQGTMRLCGLSPENSAIFRCCGLERLFPWYRDREAAVWGGELFRRPRSVTPSFDYRGRCAAAHNAPERPAKLNPQRLASRSA